MKNKEKFLENSVIPINIEGMKKIERQMENYVCKISKNEKKGTGFLFQILVFKKKYYILATNNHILNENDIKNGETITILFQNGKEYNINIEPIRITFTDKEFDITFIQIFPEKDNIKYFLEIDDNEENQNINKQILNNKYKKHSIYILHYSRYEKVLVSYGQIINIESEIIHSCNTDSGSSGAPILSLYNFKIIGYHAYGDKQNQYNIGKYIHFAIKKFSNKISDDLKKSIKNNLRKNIPFLNINKIKNNNLSREKYNKSPIKIDNNNNNSTTHNRNRNNTPININKNNTIYCMSATPINYNKKECGKKEIDIKTIYKRKSIKKKLYENYINIKEDSEDEIETVTELLNNFNFCQNNNIDEYKCNNFIHRNSSPIKFNNNENYEILHKQIKSSKNSKYSINETIKRYFYPFG